MAICDAIYVQAVDFSSNYFPGIGWGTFVLSFLGSIYYIVLISWCFYYVFASFAPDVPWGSCDNSWNSESKFYLINAYKSISHNFPIYLSDIHVSVRVVNL